MVDTVRAAGYDYVVVNDGSSDRTLAVCRANGINVLDLPQNLGIGGAVQAGHLYALERGYDVDIQVDGDGRHDISYVPRLLERIEDGSDLVVGSRFVEPSEGFQSTAARRAGIRWLSACIRWTTGLVVADVTSGFRASGRRAIELFARRYPVDYSEPESLVMAHNSGLPPARRRWSCASGRAGSPRFARSRACTTWSRSPLPSASRASPADGEGGRP